MENNNTSQFAPPHYNQLSSADALSPRQAISAPQTPVFSEYFFPPKNATGTIIPNGFATSQFYPTSNLPGTVAVQGRPIFYQPVQIQTQAQQNLPPEDQNSSAGSDSGLCGNLCGSLSCGFSRSFEQLAYGGQDASDESGGHSFKIFAETTTMHGIQYVVLPGARITIKRVLWTLVFALFWVYFISVSVKKVQFYFLFQHITQLDEESKELDFPAITICNLNPIRLSAFERSDLYNAGLMYGILKEDLTLAEDLFSSDNPASQKLRAKTNFQDEDKKKEFNLEEFQMRAGHRMKDMLKACKWRDTTCSYEDFSPVLTEMGLCYQYNNNQSWDEETNAYNYRKVYKGGAGNGLKMLLVTQEEDYLPPRIEDFDSSLETGFKIEVHDPEVPPLVHQLGIGVAPGLQTFVVLQKEVVNYLGDPWGECMGAYGNTVNYTMYSDPACRLECETQHIVDECKCRLPFMPVINTMPNSYKICSPSKVLDCAQSRLAKIEDGEACGPNTCIKACRITRYKSSLSSVKFPSYLGAIKLSEEYGDIFTQTGNQSAASKTSQSYWKEVETAISKQALVVSIYFQSLSLQTIEQVGAYDFAAMLGDIGGLMGLFIGASAMTLFEFFFFFCDSLILRRRGAKGPGGTDEEKNDLMGDSGTRGDHLKSVLMAPGAVDGAKFVFNVNHNENDYNAAMSRLLPQFSAHPLHNSFQPQANNQHPQQQQPRGYSPLMKRSSYASMPQGTAAYMQPPPQQNEASYMSPHSQDASSYPASPVPPSNGGVVAGSFQHPGHLPQNMLVTTAYPHAIAGSGGKIFLTNSLPQERYC